MSPDRPRPTQNEIRGRRKRRRLASTATALIVGLGGVGLGASVNACSSSSGTGEMSVSQFVADQADSGISNGQTVKIDIQSGEIFPTRITSTSNNGKNYAIDTISKGEKATDYAVTFIPTDKQKIVFRRI